MSYVTLEVDTCILVASPASERTTTVIGGCHVTLHTERWFQEPFFVKELPSNTWGALQQYIIDNREELAAITYVGEYLDSFINDLPEQMLDKPILSVRNPNGSSNNNSVLFPPVEQVQEHKPYREFDGYSSQPSLPITGTRQSVFCTVYNSDRSRMMTEAANAARGIYSPEPRDDVEDVTRVMNYSYVPTFNFMTMGKEKSQCFFGMELELNTKVPWNDIYRVMTEVHPIQEAFMYAKQDSSISGQFSNSYELVTHPMTPRRMRLEWKRLFKKLETLVKERGLVWEELFDMSTTSTGLHVHVSKTAFHGLSRTHKKKFMMIWNNNAKSISDFTSQLAGRKLKDSSYCSPSEAYKGRTVAWMLREGINSSRNSACNETSKTVEVRAYKGTPSLKCVLHAVDTTEALLAFTEQAPISQFNRGLPSAFQSWLRVTPPNAYRALKENLSCVS